MVGTEHLNGGHHLVQFYGHDEELVERVTGYLLEALEAGGVAIVIATPEHRREFEDGLSQGLAGGTGDLAAARDGGTYVALDASEAVRELTADGRIDGASFDRVIGGLIRQAGLGRAAGPRLRRDRRAAVGRRTRQRRDPARGDVD